MQVLLAEEYGFCFGVERAVEMVEDALAQGARVRTLGPLIHNTQEIQRLESQGVATIDAPADVEGEVTAVIRAHGVTPWARMTAVTSPSTSAGESIVATPCVSRR